MKLSVIILSYNTRDLLSNCINSLTLRQLDSLTMEIIVVDNASTDSSVEMLRREFPDVKLILNRTNRGFAAANNQALAIAHGEYVLVLNSDTLMTGTALTDLVAFLDSHPRAVAVTPKLVLPDGRIDIACHRGLPTPWNALTYFTGLERLFPRSAWFSGYHQLYKGLSTTHRVAATSATALLVRRAAIDEVGPLDERFFFYGEDLDWCKRFTDAGWEIWYYPHAVVKHLKSASGKRNAHDREAKRLSVNHFYDTMKLFYEKHYATTYPRWLRQLVYLGIDLKKRVHR